MATKAEYELKQFDQKTFAATRAIWLRQATQPDSGAHKPDVEAKLDWAEKNLDYTKGPDFAYGVFRVGASHAEAIVDVVYQKDAGKRWLKAMGVQLAPAKSLFFSEKPQNLEELVEIYSAAIFGTLKLTKVHPTKVTKLFGRSATLLAFLEGLAGAIKAQGGLKGVSVKMEGRWLVFRAQ